MYFLIIVLSFLELLSFVLNIIFISIASTQHLCLALLATFQFFANALPIPQHSAQMPVTPIWHSSIALQDHIYGILDQRLRALPHDARQTLAPYLRASHFAELAESLTNNTPLGILTDYDIKLDAAELAHATYLATLPEVICTPPEDGDRAPEPGERGGRWVKVEEGKLGVPVRVARAGRALRKEKQRKEEEKRAEKRENEKEAKREKEARKERRKKEAERLQAMAERGEERLSSLATRRFRS
jgi:hypothetical protein